MHSSEEESAPDVTTDNDAASSPIAERAALQNLQIGTTVRGLSPSGVAQIESVAEIIGSQAIKVIYRDDTGNLKDRLLYQDDLGGIEVIEAGRPWSFDGLRAVSLGGAPHTARPR